MNRARLIRRRGLTLPELLVAMTITTMVVSALGVLTHTVMEGYKQANKTGNASQAGRVVLARIGHTVATSHQVLKGNNVTWSGVLANSLIVWERDGDADDVTPGQPNWVECVIFARKRTKPTELLEVRPNVDPSLVVPVDEPALMKYWVNRFRSGVDIVQPPIVLLTETGGVGVEVVNYSDPQGIGDMVHQDVRIRLCISPEREQPTVFFGSASRRYPIPSVAAPIPPAALPDSLLEAGSPPVSSTPPITSGP